MNVAGATVGRKRISGSNFSSSSCSLRSSRTVSVVISCPLQTKTGRCCLPASSRPRALLQEACFLVELLRARVERDAGALDGVFIGDEIAIGVAGGDGLLV